MPYVLGTKQLTVFFVILSIICLPLSSRITLRSLIWNDMKALSSTKGSYCLSKDPVMPFDFTKFSQANHDHEVMLSETMNETLRLHICDELAKPCRGEKGYAICLHREGQEEIGLGREPPEVDSRYEKILFKYTGDRCDSESNYTVELEFKCSYDYRDEVALTIVNLDFEHSCHVVIDLETIKACPTPRTPNCTFYQGQEKFDLSMLRNHYDNYEISTAESGPRQHSPIMLNACGPLVQNNTHFKAPGCGPESTACFIDRTDVANPVHRSLGRLGPNTGFYMSDHEIRWVMSDGDPCPYNESVNYTTVVSFLCNPEKILSHPQYVSGLGQCFVQIMWYSSHVCPEWILRVTSGRELARPCTIRDPETLFEYDLTSLRGQVFKTQTSDGGELEMAVCGNLGARSICSDGSGVCKVLKGQSSGVSGGIGNSHLYWKKSGPYLNYTSGDSCSPLQRRWTSIEFKCGPSNSSLEVESDHPCYQRIFWTTPLVCRKPCTSRKFGLPLGHLTNDLEDYVVEHNETTYYLNVCRELVNPPPGCPKNSSACAIGPKKIDAASGNLGTSSTEPELHDPNTPLLGFVHGDTCVEDPTQNYSARIIFTCNHNVNMSYPQYSIYFDCITYFEWPTMWSCGNVHADLDETTYKIVNTLEDEWDLSPLKDYKADIHRLYKLAPFSLTMFNRSNCPGGSFICDYRQNYGREIRVMTDYSTGTVQLFFSNGSICDRNARAVKIANSWRSNKLSAVIVMKCNATAGLGLPVIVGEDICSVEFEWQTDVVCRDRENEKIRPPSGRNAPHNEMTSHWPIIFIIVSVFIVMLVVGILWIYKTDSLRQRFIVFYYRCRHFRQAPAPGNVSREDLVME
ncbi:hypothetical protein TKK_0010938 [Trichogramma kaykai]|uniref:MRH domain-containing protein n=1 Tax=Trichogramma kaykai TaxID=54128 RepID=A0ABD2WUJ6_9HYME